MHRRTFIFFAAMFFALVFSSIGYALNTSSSSGLSKTNIQVAALYIQPQSGHENYTVFAFEKTSPLQRIKVNYSPGFELALNYAPSQFTHMAYLEWLHLNIKGTPSHSTRLQLSSPHLNLKQNTGKIDFGFDTTSLNIEKSITWTPRLQSIVYGGLNLLRIKETLSAGLNTNTGIANTYVLQLQSKSEYLGAGPDLGLLALYTLGHGFGVIGDLFAVLSIGSLRTSHTLNVNSNYLDKLGMNTVYQKRLAPRSLQAVPGGDIRLGLSYLYESKYFPQFITVLGYRRATYIHVTPSAINTSSLIQNGSERLGLTTPGKNFTFSGPYLHLIMVPSI
ncbi:MAG: Lpg1974 family pore-forming outer membrane protein [Legionellaceae bacterium]|nr:Lpg1974 family pore-forming outer membrane protein [Legionellaceae bacterium]